MNAAIIPSLPFRSYLPKLPVPLVRDHVERAVRPLAHVADALVAVGEQVLFAHHAVAFDDQPHQTFLHQRADEYIPAPRGEGRPRVELRARRRDDRVPVVDRLLQALARGDVARDRLARILFAVGDDGPAVVLALLD